MDLLTHNTVVLRWQPGEACVVGGQYVIWKVHSRGGGEMKDKIMKLGTISNDLPFPISGPLTSPPPFYLAVSSLLSLSGSLSLYRFLLSCLFLSRRQSTTASVFRVEGDIEADPWDPRVRGGGASLRVCGARGDMNRGSKTGVTLGDDTLGDWFVEGTRMSFTRGVERGWRATNVQHLR